MNFPLMWLTVKAPFHRQRIQRFSRVLYLAEEVHNMKKAFLLLSVVAFGLILMSADVTRTMKTFGKTQTYWKYNGVASDTIMGTDQDTVEYPMFLNKDYPVQFYINATFDTIGEDDNQAVTVYLLGKVFEDENWAAIANSGTTTITTDNQAITVESIDNTGAFTVA